jgi:hypothetical protein
MTPVTDASAAIGPRQTGHFVRSAGRIGDLWRLLTSGSIASTALELLGVALMTNGLRLVYVPAMWVFLGVACFVWSYLIEATARRAQAPRAPAVLTLDDDDADEQVSISKGANTR